MISLCFPTLNRYDLLDVAIDTALAGTLPPDKIYVIDNGGKAQEFMKNLDKVEEVFTPGINIGVAASWNWFINNVPEIRIISNDDVEFYPDTLETLVSAYDEKKVLFPAGVVAANAFSCFLIPNFVVEVVGYFDEKISPNYAYYEDNDYFRRMNLAGVKLEGVSTSQLMHKGSATLAHGIPDHNHLFEKATKNFLAKWGGWPHEEVYEHPWNNPELTWKDW